MTLAPCLIIIGAVWLLLIAAAQEVDHTAYFFGVSGALRAIFPVSPEPDEFIQIVSSLDEAGK